MSERVVVPEGMKRAVVDAFRQAADAGQDCGFNAILEAALLWLSQHPIVPTIEQMYEIRETIGPAGFMHYGENEWKQFFAEWQRRMFRAAEPDVPEAVKDLIMPLDAQFVEAHPAKHSDRNWAILEAYRRGLRGK